MYSVYLYFLVCLSVGNLLALRVETNKIVVSNIQYCRQKTTTTTKNRSCCFYYSNFFCCYDIYLVKSTTCYTLHSTHIFIVSLLKDLDIL